MTDTKVVLAGKKDTADVVHVTAAAGQVTDGTGVRPVNITVSNTRFCHIKSGFPNILVLDRVGFYSGPANSLPHGVNNVAIGPITSFVTGVVAQGFELVFAGSSDGSDVTDGTEIFPLYLLVPLDVDPA